MLQGGHSAILLTFIKLLFGIKVFVLSIFEWPLKTGVTVLTSYLSIEKTNISIKATTRKLCILVCAILTRFFSFGFINCLITANIGSKIGGSLYKCIAFVRHGYASCKKKMAFTMGSH